MSKPFPLQPLADLAKHHADVAVRKLGDLNQQNQKIGNKLELLLQYRQEYQLRFEESLRSGMNQIEWQNYQHFLAKLDDAIDQQKQLQLAFVQVVEAGQLEYQLQQKKMKSFETLADRHKVQESSKAAKIEQRELDDLSSKSFLRKTDEDT